MSTVAAGANAGAVGVDVGFARGTRVVGGVSWLVDNGGVVSGLRGDRVSDGLGHFASGNSRVGVDIGNCLGDAVFRVGGMRLVSLSGLCGIGLRLPWLMSWLNGLCNVGWVRVNSCESPVGIDAVP